MVEMGLTTPHIDQIIADFEADSGIMAAKISGSGLGDCVLALGEIKEEHFPHTLLELKISKQGLQIEGA